jgi:hypothetical protein
MYAMSELRKMTGTPVKRGALVKIRSGAWAGRKGYVRRATNYGTVEVTDCATGRYGWWTTVKPNDLEYIDLRPNA